MSTVSVLCRLPYGLVLDEPHRHVVLQPGVNKRVPRDAIEQWLGRNAHLAAVKRGDISINSRTRK